MNTIPNPKPAGWFTRHVMHAPSVRANFWAGAANAAANKAYTHDYTSGDTYLAHRCADKACQAAAHGFPSIAYANAKQAIRFMRAAMEPKLACITD